jgi:site-specific DNA recombinase
VCAVNRERTVTVIPPTARRFDANAPVIMRKRVAAYARVSTDKDEQQTSYEAQVDYYTRHIKSNPEWEFVEVYTDEGISGTSTKRREGFKRMMQDALNGGIDLILTKSVSRFARNTVDTLTAIRKLKEKGVEVYFEKENIYTLDAKGELLLTIFSSLAQEESRSISENITWGKRKRFAVGKVTLPYAQFLGYEKGEDGLPKVVEEEAKIVRRIYAMFLEGKTPSSIARILTGDSIPTPSGKINWQGQVVESILTNEKYYGAAFLQKRITVDFLTKEMKLNEGEAPMYFIESSHTPIVSPIIFELAQEEFRRRKSLGKKTYCNHIFASRIVCGECGASYGRKLWHSTDKYRRWVWQCNNKFHRPEKCKTPHLYEDTVKRLFVEVWNHIIASREEILADYELIAKQITDTSELEAQHKTVEAEITDIVAAVERFIKENAQSVLDQTEYARRHSGYVKKYRAAEQRRADITLQITRKKAKYLQMTEFLGILSEHGSLLTEFDDKLWCLTVRALVVKSKTEVVFQFKDGSERPWPLDGY